MGANDAVADAEAEAGAFAGGLGGEERIEDAFGLADAGAVVDESDFDEIRGLAGANADFAVIAGFLDGVVGVIENIEENLLQLLRIADGHLEIFVELFGDFDAMTGKVVAAEANGLAKDGIDLHGLALSGALASKAQKALHDFLGSLGFAKNDLQFFAGGRGNLGIFEQQVGEAEDRGEGIVDFVSDAGDQAADGGHFFGVRELGL